MGIQKDKNTSSQVYVFQYGRQKMNKYTNKICPVMISALEKNKPGKVTQNEEEDAILLNLVREGFIRW